jgi:thiamine biosynthesis lipoprotein
MLQTLTFRCMTTDIELFLDTPAEVADEDARQVLAEVERFFQSVDARFSRFRADSELSALNAASGRTVAVSPDLAALVRLALDASVTTGGIFDPTMIDALEAAGYDRSIELVSAGVGQRRQPGVPLPERWTGVQVDTATRRVTLPAGVRLDLGGIGKGWAADKAAAMLRPYGAGMVNAGGDLCAWGDQPGAETGQGWLVAVDNPSQPGGDVAWLPVVDSAVATSSITRRRWAGGHHLIDPRTGNPAETDVVSVTALASTVVRAEVAAKVVLILGRVMGLAWLERQPDVEALLIGANGGKVYCTPGLQQTVA